MKTEVSIIVIVVLALFPQQSLNLGILCKTQMIQFYGLSGLSHSIPYEFIQSVASEDFCPGLQQSCCTSEDFILTRQYWNDSAKKIKVYLSQIFKILQKISMLQGSLTQFMPRIQSKNTARCRKIDSTFFNSPIRFDEMHFYIQNALEAFAYLQKGFYCMVCDPNKLANIALTVHYNRFWLQLSPKSCDDIVFFFREFIAYRLYFFDPLILNLNYVLNCIHDNDDVYFDTRYEASYQAVNDCLINHNYCWKLCKEIRIGGSTNLFVGQLNEYKKILKYMKEVMLDLGHTPLIDEIEILDENPASVWFELPDDIIILNNMNVIKDVNITRAEIIFTDGGFDLFDNSVSSNYFLTDGSNMDEVKLHYALFQQSSNGMNSLSPNLMRPVNEYLQAPALANMSPDYESASQQGLPSGQAVNVPDSNKQNTDIPDDTSQMDINYMEQMKLDTPDGPSGTVEPIQPVNLSFWCFLKIYCENDIWKTTFIALLVSLALNL